MPTATPTPLPEVITAIDAANLISPFWYGGLLLLIFVIAMGGFFSVSRWVMGQLT